MKLIFLDIDGVLVNRWSLMQRSGREAPFAPECRDALNRLIFETGAAIVITSTWRFNFEYPNSELRGLFRDRAVSGALIGCTPGLRKHYNSPLFVGQARGREIQQWLDDDGERFEIESFVIIDDDSDMGEVLLPRLVKTQHEIGLTTDDARRAVAILNAPLERNS